MRLQFVEGGEIVNVHGLKGEIKVLPWVDSPEDLVEFDRCRIARKDYEIELGRVQKTCALLKLTGVDTVEEAQKLRGKTVLLYREDIDPEVIFAAELIGVEVFENDVKIGDILFTYETDKASFECESTAEGELLAIFFDEGEEVPCMENVCAVGPHGEPTDCLKPGAAPAAIEAAPVEAAPAAEAAPVAAPAVPTKASAPISPRAAKLAESAGVNVAFATGTGPNGRIIERDIRKLMENPAAYAVAAPAAVSAAPAAEEYKDVKFSGIRRAISKSMTTSLHTMAQLTHNTSFDATAIMNYRKALKAAGGEYAGITLGDIVLYAVSRTLLNHPDLNANMLDDNSIRIFNHVNLGVAVDTPRGLMVPTIFHADEMSLLEISQAVKSLAAECREGAISPDKLSGGSFTVSNLGNLGVESFTPVINPPQTGILGVCGTIDRVRKGADGSIELYPAMGLSLTYDHRAVDGTPAAKFQKELAFNLENFTVLLSK